MGEKFKVEIEAIDKFTKVFRDLNDRASKATRPIQNVYRQVGALSHEMHLDKFAAGLERVSSIAPTMARNLGLSLGPIESLLGIGAAGGIIGGLGAAAGAIGVLTVKSAAAGFEVKRTADQLGVSADMLQRYRGAARQANLDSEAVTEAVRGMGDTLQNARFGRDPPAMAALNRLGIGIKLTRDGVVDVDATLRDLENALSRIGDPHVRNVIADTLHIPREAIPFLKMGADEIERLKRAVTTQDAGQLRWAEDFTNSLNRLNESMRGVALTWGSTLVPSLTKGLNSLNSDIGAGNFDKFFTPGLARGSGSGWSVSWLRNWLVPSPKRSGPMSPIPPDQRGLLGGGPSPATFKNDTDFARAVQMSPEEQARAAAQDTSDVYVNELRREIGRAKPGSDQAYVMQAELQRIQVEINLKNAPPGTRVTAQNANGTPVPARIGYSMAAEPYYP